MSLSSMFCIFLLWYLDFNTLSVAKKPIYIGSMSPLTGKYVWWARGIPVAAEMAFEYINNRSDVLRDYELRLMVNNTKGLTGRGNMILYDYLQNRKVLMVLGPARTNVALSVSHTAKYWNLIQVSASATSGTLSRSISYPYFFRTIPSLSATSTTFVALARRFRWKKVAILFYSRDMQAHAALKLKEQCNKNNITVLSYGSYLDADDAENQIQHLKDIDARVIFGFLQKTTSIMCKIFKYNMYGSQYAWVINTPDNKTSWWQRTYNHLSCTKEQVNQAADNVITIDHLLLSQGTQRGISGLTPQEFQEIYKLYSQQRSLPISMYGAFAFDAAWLIALALNTTARELGPNRTLNQFRYKDAYMSGMMKKSLLNTEFIGVTGSVNLERNGDRYGNFEVAQLRGKSLDPVGIYDVLNDNFTLLPGKDFGWKGGRPPSDHVTIVPRLVKFSSFGFIVICACSSFGIVLSFGFLYFNIVYRNKRFIKMSSPNINNLIIAGCILAYVSVILFSVDGEQLSDVICETRVFTLNIGFTLAFGAMFSKTWRVHRITRKLRMKRRVLQDIHLVGMVLVFLAIDLIVLVLWLVLDPLVKDYKWFDIKSQSPMHPDIIYRQQIIYCRTNNVLIWLVVLYGVKALLLLFGLFLAWETRKVKITALNDSHHIGMAVYNVFIVCIIGVPITLLLSKEMYEVSFIITAFCIMSCTTLTICLVFVPKIRRLRKFSLDETANDIPSFKIRFGSNTMECTCECHQQLQLEGQSMRSRREPYKVTKETTNKEGRAVARPNM